MAGFLAEYLVVGGTSFIERSLNKLYSIDHRHPSLVSYHIAVYLQLTTLFPTSRIYILCIRCGVPHGGLAQLESAITRPMDHAHRLSSFDVMLVVPHHIPRASRS